MSIPGERCLRFHGYGDGHSERAFEVFFDSTGTPVRLQVEENYTSVFTATVLRSA